MTKNREAAGNIAAAECRMAQRTLQAVMPLGCHIWVIAQHGSDEVTLMLLAQTRHQYGKVLTFLHKVVERPCPSVLPLMPCSILTLTGETLLLFLDAVREGLRYARYFPEKCLVLATPGTIRVITP